MLTIEKQVNSKYNIQIIATVGPASMKKSIIKKMDDSGIDIFRINLSHTNIDDLIDVIKQLQSWTKKNVAIDTEGSQLRTSMLKNNEPFSVLTGHLVEIVSLSEYRNEGQIPINQSLLNKIFIGGDIIKIDFDNVIMQIVEHHDKIALARVIEGGVIKSNKGISTDRPITLPCFSKKDIQSFNIVNKSAIDTIFLSFCSHPDNIIDLRTIIKKDIHIISKIENELALRNLDGICQESDGILIDRGDLSRDVPLEKIIYAQSYIIERAKKYNVSKYVATNLMENMIGNQNPTRAEIHDIVSSIKSGVNGLVLAAETAIGNNPVNCTRVLARIIDETKNATSTFINKRNDDLVDYLMIPSNNKIVKPHGGILVQQFVNDYDQKVSNGLPYIYINEKNECDIIQICEGTYSPITGFMNTAELESVLHKNKLINDEVWTLPILLFISPKCIKDIPSSGTIALKRERDNLIIAHFYIEAIEMLHITSDLLKLFYGTDDKKHPGVAEMINGSGYIISGKPFLIKENIYSSTQTYSLSPRQTRDIFHHNRWHNIVGFHTRNIVHRGHEYIQLQALEKINGDAIFISPVTGPKKKGDFKSEAIIASYQKMIASGIYDPFGVLLGSFNTFSRYCGPREAIFTAICRKNYGCNYFIVGRDHTGVANYYPQNASINKFKEFDLNMKILSFNAAYYNSDKKIITDELIIEGDTKQKLDISATQIRENIIAGKSTPEYLIRPDLFKLIEDMYTDNPNQVFHQ